MKNRFHHIGTNTYSPNYLLALSKYLCSKNSLADLKLGSFTNNRRMTYRLRATPQYLQADGYILSTITNRVVCEIFSQSIWFKVVVLNRPGDLTYPLTKDVMFLSFYCCTEGLSCNRVNPTDDSETVKSCWYIIQIYFIYFQVRFPNPWKVPSDSVRISRKEFMLKAKARATFCLILILNLGRGLYYTDPPIIMDSDISAPMVGWKRTVKM